MSRFGAHSVLGGNLRFLDYNYLMDYREIQKKWIMSCQSPWSQWETMRIVEQVKELQKEMITFIGGFLPVQSVVRLFNIHALSVKRSTAQASERL